MINCKRVRKIVLVLLLIGWNTFPMSALGSNERGQCHSSDVVSRCYVEVPDKDDNVHYERAIIMARVKLVGEKSQTKLLEVLAPPEFKQAWPFVLEHIFLECNGPSRILTREEHLKMFSCAKRD